MNTLGDQVLDKPLPKIGEKSLFTKELETALHTGDVDFVVHSLKDLPTVLPEGMAIGAVLTREDPRDALVLNKDHSNCTLETLPNGSVIGTSSLRRTAQLARKYPHLKIESIRGNLNTRLRKLDELGKYGAIVLAAAGLVRMGWQDRISKILDTDELLYAVGQGALAVECREDDKYIIDLLRPIYDIQTALTVLVERSCLKTLGGGCSAPVAVCTTLNNIENNKFKVSVTGGVWSLDGKEEIIQNDKCEIEVEPKILCALCPLNNNKKGEGNIEDIECLKDCIAKRISPEEVPQKRSRLDEVPTELLKNDPHQYLPIQIPVGADFMGQCPYLERNLVSINELSKAMNIKDDKVKTMECPFRGGKLNIEDFKIEGEGHSSKDNSNLFCGLVPHKDVKVSIYKEVQGMGERLAQNLIKQGALEIMSKAQAIIHGTAPLGNSVNVATVKAN